VKSCRPDFPNWEPGGFVVLRPAVPSELCGFFRLRTARRPATLVLTRKVGEEIYIGDDIVVTVIRISSDRVRLGISAPRNVNIVRQELATSVKDSEEDSP
jgi:carbon storage regulator